MNFITEISPVMLGLPHGVTVTVSSRSYETVAVKVGYFSDVVRVVYTCHNSNGSYVIFRKK